MTRQPAPSSAAATREAFVLPIVFLTVVLLGGVRVAERIALVPPSLFAFVLATLLVGVLVRCGALAPDRLMNAARPGVANVNGLMVLIAAFLASAQAFSVVTPESGLPRVLFSVLFLVLLVNTLAAAPDRSRVLRSFGVIFGSAFILKFIVLASLSDPDGGRTKRVVLALLEGVTLGTLSQEAVHPVTGYLAFFTLILFLAGLAFLPAATRDIPDTRRLAPPARIELPE
jgi:hypothetical protein